MDQTPIPFSLHGKQSLDSCVTCTVDICKSTGDTRHATLAVMVISSGRMLPPFLIFEGRPGSQIKWEFSTFPKDRFYACMKVWVEQIPKAMYLQQTRWDCSHFFVDIYHCHMMELVVSIITQLWMEVLHIPGSCTGLCQPIDVGINK